MSSSDMEGWTEVAEFEEAEYPDYEEADYAARELDEGNRGVDVVSGQGSPQDRTLLESETTIGERWVRVATFTGPDPYQDSEPTAESLNGSDDYRVVVVKHGDVALEKKIGDDE